MEAHTLPDEKRTAHLYPILVGLSSAQLQKIERDSEGHGGASGTGSKISCGMAFPLGQ